MRRSAASRNAVRGPFWARLAPLALWAGLAAVACGDSGVVVPDESTGASSSTATTTADDPTTAGDPTTGGATTGSAATSGEGTTGVATTGSATTDGSTTGDAGASTTDGLGDGTSSTGADDGETSETAETSETGETGDPEAPEQGPKVKVMTFNIRVGTANDGEDAWDKRKGLVYQVFEQQDADFVGVQEAHNFQLVEIDEHVAGYARIGVGTYDGKVKGPLNAIYYRKSRFKVDDSDTFWLSDTPGMAGSQTWGNKFPRAVTWGHFVEKTTQYGLYVYNTHFDHVSQNSREKSAALLAKRISNRAHAEDPFVVTGDFNAGEGNLVVRFLKGNAKIAGADNPVPMRDSFRVVHPDATNVGTAHGFNGGTGGNKIDYVFVPPKQKVTGASIDHFNKDGRYPSDHFPVVGTIRFEADL